MAEKFCPFIKGICRKDCTFYHPCNSDNCLIAGRLNGINDMEYDQLDKIYQAIKGKD